MVHKGGSCGKPGGIQRSVRHSIELEERIVGAEAAILIEVNPGGETRPGGGYIHSPHTVDLKLHHMKEDSCP